jgi:peptide/nickel transport system substrate-binding protein
MTDVAYWDGFWSRRLRRRRLLRGAAIAAMGVAVGCGGNTAAPVAPTPAANATASTANPAATPTAAALRPKQGGTFRWASTSKWAHLDPHQSSSSPNFGQGAGLGYSRLLKFKLLGVPMPSTVPIPDLAESWDQPDDLTYIFKLRKGVKFHNLPPVNGREFVAEDVVYSFNRQTTRGFPNADFLAGMAKLEAVDKYTVKITLDVPAADFSIGVAAPQSLIVAREAVELNGDLKQGPTIGTGAFVLKSADQNKGEVFVRNPDYFLPGFPHIDELDRIVTGEDVAVLQALKSKETDGGIALGKPQAEEVVAFRKDATILKARGAGSGVEFALKLDRPPLNDLRVRKAIYMAVDRQQIIDTVYGGDGWFTVGVTLPQADWNLPEEELKKAYKRDVEGARRLMREAGQEAGFDLVLSTTTILLNNMVAESELVQQQLKDIGVRVTIKATDHTTFTTAVQGRGEYEAYLGTALSTPSADVGLFTRWHSKGGRNTMKISDPQLDQMIEKQTTLGRNPEQRKALLQDIQRRILDQAYLNFIHGFQFSDVLANKVHDYVPGTGVLSLDPDRWSQIWLD